MEKGFTFTPSLARLVNKARKLREWTRAGVFDEAGGNPKIASPTGESRQKHLNKRINQVNRDQKTLNKFYADLGFDPLPKDHEIVRAWTKRIGSMHKGANRTKRRQRPNQTTASKAGSSESGEASNETPASKESRASKRRN